MLRKKRFIIRKQLQGNSPRVRCVIRLATCPWVLIGALGTARSLFWLLARFSDRPGCGSIRWSKDRHVVRVRLTPIADSVNLKMRSRQGAHQNSRSCLAGNSRSQTVILLVLGNQLHFEEEDDYENESRTGPKT